MSLKKKLEMHQSVHKKQPFFSMSISARLATSFTLSAFVMLAIFTAIQHSILIRTVEWDEKQVVLDRIMMLETALRVYGDNHLVLDHEVNLEGGAYWPEQQYVQYSRIQDENGRTIIETSGMEEMLPAALFPQPYEVDLITDQDGIHYLEAPNGQAYFLTSTWVRSDDVDGAKRVIQVALNETGERAILAGYSRDTLLALFTGTLLFAIVSAFIVRRSLRPLHELAKTARAITANNLTAEADPDVARWPNELRSLADSFYSMLSRINVSYNRCSQCAEEMAHELRNPIQVLMGEAEVILARERTPEEYRQVLESSLEEYNHLARMINELLFISRADNPYMAIQRSRIDARNELEVVRDFYEALSFEQEIAITCVGQACLDADSQLLRRALSNLVCNAVMHTPQGGKIQLEAKEVKGKNVVEILVRDNGCGIASEALPHIFDRFYSVENKNNFSGQGIGLGLPIVKSIMNLHGGSVEIKSIQGTGTTVVLRFPIQAADNHKEQAHQRKVHTVSVVDSTTA
jgi:two-component system heavy metal sensor histidine kinase CusS